MDTFEHLPPDSETLAGTVEHVTSHSDLQQTDLPAAISVSMNQGQYEHAVHDLVSMRRYFVRHGLRIYSRKRHINKTYKSFCQINQTS